ncbi:nicotinamide N-methyltransferase [Hysterangium stoloniferum]|nr:nicotinamide N-methyltransferase [Hysterangium stoloniferum]
MQEADLNLGDIFISPPSPPPPEPKYTQYERLTVLCGENGWKSLSIRLIGSHPLWGHYLWNAARCFATYLDQNAQDLCVGKGILELGAGGALPSIVAILCGARRTVITDYPDQALLDNIRINVKTNISAETEGEVDIQGHIWGRTVDDLLRNKSKSKPDKFDVILMSDLIFNHSQHVALLQTAESCLAEASPSSIYPCVLVFYTHHRPHLAKRDLEFFVIATQRGWSCEEVVTEAFEPMFPEDGGDEIMRSTVHGWRLTRASGSK